MEEQINSLFSGGDPHGLINASTRSSDNRGRKITISVLYCAKTGYGWPIHNYNSRLGTISISCLSDDEVKIATKCAAQVSGGTYFIKLDSLNEDNYWIETLPEPISTETFVKNELVLRKQIANY